MYNDLGRLIRAKQVEQAANSNLNVTDPVTGNSGWSVAYAYDNNGNITSTTDANNQTVTGVYDALNRLTSRDYSDSTPDVTFTFDNPNITNSKGQLTAVTSSVSSTYYTSFDELGRIKSSQQVTAGQTYNFSTYGYDLSGAPVSETYPSGRTLTIQTDDIGRLSTVKSQPTGQTEKTYLSNLSYTSFGAIESAKLGNNRWESAQFDPKRLLPTQTGLGISQGDTSLLKVEYSYGTTNNNGALLQQKITVPGAANQIIQDYTYDALNRLLTATETAAGSQTWKQTFTYDRFGNRRFDAANTTTFGSCAQAICNPDIDLATNRLTTSDGYTFDNEGSLTANPESQLFSYDAENHLKEVQNTATQTTSTYEYDGLGKRVKKASNLENTIFVYDAMGRLAEEYPVSAPTQVSTAYIYAGGRLLATETSTGTNYLTADQLGSPRINTDASGNVLARHDYMPFGEEVFAGVGGRTTTQGYGASDGVRQQFTGYERDDDSGLDYAQARYFSSKHGRFTSVDPLAASANIKSPQTLNRYSYAMNSPYKFTDPSGLRPCTGSELVACDESGDLKGGSESSQMWAAQDEERHNAETVDIINDAVRNGDQDKARQLCEENPGVVCTGESNESSGSSESNLACCPGTLAGPFVVPAEKLDRFGREGELSTPQPLIDDGSCAKLPQNLMDYKIGTTDQWMAGERVSDLSNLQRGTIIATFNKRTRRYPGADTGNHAAVFLSFGRETSGTHAGDRFMWVIDQYPQKGEAGIRKIYFGRGAVPDVPGGNSSNDARVFYVVRRFIPFKHQK